MIIVAAVLKSAVQNDVFFDRNGQFIPSLKNPVLYAPYAAINQ